MARLRSLSATAKSGVAASSMSPTSLGDALRRAERQCWLLAHLASGREGVPSPHVWDGLNDLLREHAELFEAIVRTLPAEVLDEPRDA